MAVRTSLKYLAKRIGGAVRSFAAGAGWDGHDIAIAGTFDEETERFYIQVGSDRRIDERQWHAGIMNAIRGEFVDFPSITSKLVLVVRNVDKPERIYYEMIVGEGDIDITELL